MWLTGQRSNMDNNRAACYHEPIENEHYWVGSILYCVEVKLRGLLERIENVGISNVNAGEKPAHRR